MDSAYLMTASGVREVWDCSDEESLAVLRRVWQASGFGLETLDLDVLARSMREAETAGRVGRIAFGSCLTALDCALGDVRISRLKEKGLCVDPPILFDVNVEFQWEPVDAQRLVLWACQFGKQEAVVASLWRQHFEERTSLTSSLCLQRAGTEAGLKLEAIDDFLAGDDLKVQVHNAYERNQNLGIRWPPFIVLNGPLTNGGPFRDGSRSCRVIRGPAEAYADAFEQIVRETRAAWEVSRSVPQWQEKEHDQRGWWTGRQWMPNAGERGQNWHSQAGNARARRKGAIEGISWERR